MANLRAVAEFAATEGATLLVVGPPPVADTGQNERIAALDRSFRDAAAGHARPYVSVFDALLADSVWMREVRLGDGAHPGADGYARLADLVQRVWEPWLGS